MAVSLYDLTVPSYLQTLGAIEGVLSKGAAHCKEKNIDPNEIVETRLAPDMLPFRFQIVAVAHHSAGAIKGVKAGAFGPPSASTADYAGLQKLVTEAREALEKAKPDEVNSCEGKDVIFSVGERKNREADRSQQNRTQEDYPVQVTDGAHPLAGLKDLSDI